MGNLTPRSSKRSVLSLQPLSETQNELNIKRNTNTSKPITKEALRSFHNTSSIHKTTPTKSPSFFRKNFRITKDNNPPISKTPISKVTPSKLKFSIHQDDQTPSKIPISKFKPDTILDEPKHPGKKSLASLIGNSISSTDQPHDPIPNTNISLLPDAKEGSLVHQAQLPFILLNNWFKITEHKIIDPSAILKEQYLYTVTHVELFSEALIYAKCTKDDEEKSVLLLNYKQNFNDALEINKQLRHGSKILLIEGFDTHIGLKVYKNWKILVNND